MNGPQTLEEKICIGVLFVIAIVCFVFGPDL